MDQIAQTTGTPGFNDIGPFLVAAEVAIATVGALVAARRHSFVADPRFVAPAQSDYRLRLDSPAVDAGDNDYVPLFVTTDLGGGPRFADVPAVPDTGHGTPLIVDIGAFELVSRDVFLPLISK
jgi:hypothetical protein